MTPSPPVLIPRYGMAGSAWATAVSFTVLTLSYGVISQRLWPVPFQTRKLACATILILVFGVASLYLPDHLPLVEALAIKIAYILGFIASLFIVGSIDRVELSRLFGNCRTR